MDYENSIIDIIVENIKNTLEIINSEQPEGTEYEWEPVQMPATNSTAQMTVKKVSEDAWSYKLKARSLIETRTHQQMYGSGTVEQMESLLKNTTPEEWYDRLKKVARDCDGFYYP